MNIDISVLVVAYNHEAYIERALASIAAQRISGTLEVIVADDASSDSTVATVESWMATTGFPVRVLPPTDRLGITRNYERGFAACTGEFIAVLEGDDEWLAIDKLERQSQLLRADPTLSMAASRILLFDDDTGGSKIIPLIGAESFITRVSDRELAETNWFATFSACMYRADLLRALDPALFELTAYDWLINMAVMAHGDAALLPEVMTLYRQHSSGEWSQMKQLDRDRQLQKLIPQYIELLGPRLARELTRTARHVDARLRDAATVTDLADPVLDPGLGYALPVPRYSRATPPRVSVVMTCYNHADYVLEAATSVLTQTMDDLELVIVDDGSADASMGQLQAIDDPRVRIYQLGNNQGAAAALNIAIQQTRAPLIAVINSDDAWEPEKLNRQLAVLDANPELGAVFTAVQLIGEDSQPLPEEELPGWADTFRQANRSQGAWLRRFFEEGNCLCHPSVLIRREFYERFGLYDNRMRQIPDLKMWTSLIKRYPIHVLGDEELVRFRLRRGEANASSTSSHNVIRGVREHLDLNEHFFDDVSDAVLLEGFGDVLRDSELVTPAERDCAIAFLWLDVHGPMHGVNRAQGLRELRALLGEHATATILRTRYNVTDLTLHELAQQPDDLPAAEFARWLAASGVPIVEVTDVEALPSGVLMLTILRRMRAARPWSWPARTVVAYRVARSARRGS